MKPKPFIQIEEQPILWHIMKEYSHYGFKEFIICLGYKAYAIKEYFSDYFLHTSDVTFDLAKNQMTVHNNYAEDWKVTLVDTGLNTMTGGRIKRIQKYVGNETFMLTYGDGVSDVNISELVEFHKSHGKLATMTAVNVGQRFGVLVTDNQNNITAFREKRSTDGSIINGGYMVLEPKVSAYTTDGDSTVFEQKPLEKLAEDNQLVAYEHKGFWQCMDTQRDKMQLEEMWNNGSAKWKVWEI